MRWLINSVEVILHNVIVLDKQRVVWLKNESHFECYKCTFFARSGIYYLNQLASLGGDNKIFEKMNLRKWLLPRFLVNFS